MHNDRQDSRRYMDGVNNGWDADPFATTFIECICCHREKGQLKESFTVHEGQEPHRGVLHKGVFEVHCIPFQQICQAVRVQPRRQEDLQVHAEGDGDVREEVEAEDPLQQAGERGHGCGSQHTAVTAIGA